MAAEAAMAAVAARRAAADPAGSGATLSQKGAFHCKARSSFLLSASETRTKEGCPAGQSSFQFFLSVRHAEQIQCGSYFVSFLSGRVTMKRIR